MTLLLRQQPVAGDLREISASSHDCRYGKDRSQTADIADITKYITKSQLEIHPTIFTMGKVVGKMVDDSINAYVRRDRNWRRM